MKIETMKLSIVCLVLVCLLLELKAEESLYDVLGVKRTASAKEIKTAYKNKAIEWHPDKNPDPGANERFMKINEAYTTLSDKEKRQDYDNFGTTSAQADGGRRGGGNGFGGFEDSPFGRSFFRQGGFGFNFHANRHESNVDKYRLNLRSYKETILPGSSTKPYLIYAYAGFCYQCMQIETMWDKIVQDMNTIGMGVGSLHVQLDHALANKLRISDVPTILVVIDGNLQYFNGRFSLQDLREFVRGLVPKDTVTEVSDRNYEEFLQGWEDNRVRMLFFGSKQKPTLRYVMPAYAHKQRVAAGYVNLAHINSEGLQDKYNVPKGMESILMFNEYSDRPIAQFSMSSLSLSTLNEAIESNKFLVLPRLSSQTLFNTLCPLHTSIRRKKLCVLLLTHSKQNHQEFKDSYRDFAKSEQGNERLKFAYVHQDVQGDFVNKLTKGESVQNTTLNTLKVAVVWRSENLKVHYDWLEDGWAVGEDNSLSRQRLTQLIQESLKSRDVLPYSIEMAGELIDENRGSLLYRIAARLVRWMDVAWEMILSMDEMTMITIGTTCAFIGVIALMMKMMVNGDDERYNTRARRQRHPDQYTETRHHTGAAARRAEAPIVYLNTLCAETFTDIVMDVPPGVRTIVILINQETRDKLMKEFAKVVQPYARSDAFKFAFLQLEEYLPWYKELLEESLDHSRKLENINMKNCIGTVLALNGKRKYFSVYHAAAESLLHYRRRHGRRPKSRSQLGDFLGLNDSDSEWETEGEGDPGDLGDERILDSMLLAGLPTWMDRLCEGTLRRLRIDEWPDMASFSQV